MPKQPNFQEPFLNDHERAVCLADLLAFSARLDILRELALRPDGLSPELPHAVDRFPGDNAHSRLKNLLTLFDDELREISDARNRVVHGIKLNDPELRAAQWLAREMLKLVDPERPAVAGEV